jgi:hypothetical protein
VHSSKRKAYILDNFQYVQGAINLFHKAKTPLLFIKLDIAKAFDSVWWKYLLEVLRCIGFGQRWRVLISVIWSKTSSRGLFNRTPGKPIKHRRGSGQGYPLSPMLFILAMVCRLLLQSVSPCHAHDVLKYLVHLNGNIFFDDSAKDQRLRYTYLHRRQPCLVARYL